MTVHSSLDSEGGTQKDCSRSKQPSLARLVLVVFLTVVAALLCSHNADAHDAPYSNILLDVGLRDIDVELQLPIYDLSLALSLPFNQRPPTIVSSYGDAIKSYVRQHMQAHTDDNQPIAIDWRSLTYQRINDGDWVVARLHLPPPASTSIQSLVLDYDVIIKPVITHNALLSLRHDFRHGQVSDKTTPMVLLGYQLTHFKLDLTGGSWWQGFSSIFALGMKHIAEGTDHMLFLLTLLLPAPLLAVAGRWQQTQSIKASVWKIIKTVSGFTIGHSVTLALGALGLITVPSKPIEVLIAASILISALHAMRPVFHDKELYLAAGFGLIHGLAFASSLAGLGYDTTVLLSSILGFNLGIEAMQLVIVVAVLPWLLLLSRTALYGVVRWGAALIAAFAALGWIGERTIGLRNPMSGVVDAITRHALIGVVALACLALTASILARVKPGFLTRISLAK